jgi:hypothetical protein
MVMLVAAVGSPRAARALGWPVVLPLGVTPRVLGLTAALAGVAYIGTVLIHERSRSASLEAGLTVLAAVTLALPLSVIMHHRSTGYFTTAALADGMAILLFVHALGSTLRLAARRGSPATMLADHAMIAAALLLVSFWILAGMRLHYAAAPLLLVVGATLVLVGILRLPDWLAPRWTSGPIARGRVSVSRPRKTH